MSKQLALMDQIQQFAVPKKSIAIWWMGQNGYLFKSPEGTIAAVDLYLSDICERQYSHLGDFRRCIPSPIKPGDLRVHAYLCTHSHLDHLDPDTVASLRNKETIAFVGSGQCADIYKQCGVEASRNFTIWPKAEYECRDLKLTATFAVPTDDSDLNHVGFILRFGNGPKIYVTGDTDHHPLLYSAATYSPDVLITCINGGFNNLSHWEAADVAAKIRPKLAIPCHYDMFADNGADPKHFKAALRVQAADTKYAELQHFTPFVFEAD